MKVEEPAVVEDTLAGQMAAMRGGSVKKIRSESDHDESSTDASDDKEAVIDFLSFFVLVLYPITDL